MIDYEKIDSELIGWAQAKGYTVQTRYRDEAVRGFEIRSKDNQKKVQIGITSVTETEVELAVFDGKKRRERMSSAIDDLLLLLDRAEELAVQWLA